MGILTVFWRNKLVELALYLHDILAGCQPGAVGDPEYVCVDSNGGMPEGCVKHHIGCFSAHARKRFECCSGLWHFAIILADQDIAGLDDVLGLGVKKADGLDVPLESFKPQRLDCRWRVGDRVKPCCRLVDADIRGLSRKNDGDQKFKWCAVGQLRGGVRVFGLKSGKYLLALLRIHGDEGWHNTSSGDSSVAFLPGTGMSRASHKSATHYLTGSMVAVRCIRQDAGSFYAFPV